MLIEKANLFAGLVERQKPDYKKNLKFHCHFSKLREYRYRSTFGGAGEVRDMDIEKILTGLADFQQFSRNPTLQRMLDDVDSRYQRSQPLTEKELSFVAAAGDPYSAFPGQKTKRDFPFRDGSA